MGGELGLPRPGRLEIPGGHPRIFPGREAGSRPRSGFPQRSSEPGTSGRSRSWPGPRAERREGGAGCYLAHPRLRGSSRPWPLRQPAGPGPREACGPPAVASPGPPQSALKLQQERLELDSGKTVPIKTSGRLSPGLLSTPRSRGLPSPSGRAVARAGRRGLQVLGAGALPVELPSGSPVGLGQAVPRLQRFQFELLGMNHPPFPPPVLLSGLLHPRPQWPASRTEQHRPSTSDRPSLGCPARALPGLWPEDWSRAGFSAGTHSRGPRKEALLPHSLCIRTPEAQGTTPHPCLQQDCLRPRA
ncbi:uncharacterized protein LOC115297735 [Suricata suricatta]|uniref:uncharacterized protein LOC115297735 n=1 Tax=Suricata suricatta TaxID=37032 RepID=UPI001155A7D1|nr:uncharacterized protein LOC115297735 [Suricata suricatta]